MGVWAIVVAAGSGARFGGQKQFEDLEGRRVVDWALVASRSVAEGVILVVPADHVEDGAPVADAVVTGGATRSASVRAGLAAVPDEGSVVVVHAAALRRAHADAGEATDDAALVEAAGGKVVVVPGDPANTKITLRTDLG